MIRYDKLEKLQDLRSQGALTEEEFQEEKQRLLNTPEGASPPPLTRRSGKLEWLAK